MARTLSIIGIKNEELTWIRLMILLLRHPDPVVPELVRQALLYLEASASRSGAPVSAWWSEKIASKPNHSTK